MSILAEDSTALVEALGWHRYMLLGHSMGGFVAQRMAVANPARILGLMLMDTGHGPVEGLDPDQVSLAATIAAGSRHGHLGRSHGRDRLATRYRGPSTPSSKSRPGYAQFEDRKLRSTSPYLYASIAQELVIVPGLGSRASPQWTRNHRRWCSWASRTLPSLDRRNAWPGFFADRLWPSSPMPATARNSRTRMLGGRPCRHFWSRSASSERRRNPGGNSARGHRRCGVSRGSPSRILWPPPTGPNSPRRR